MDRCEETLRSISRLAKIELEYEDCEPVESIKEFLSRLSEAKDLVEGIPPLYHVWESESHLRVSESYPGVNVEELGVDVEGGYIKFPWRGK